MNASDTRLDECPSAAAGLDTRPAGAETLVYDARSGRVHVLNAIAARILAQCDGATSVGTMVDDIVAKTAADRARVARDVLAVFEDFRGKGLLR